MGGGRGGWGWGGDGGSRGDASEYRQCQATPRAMVPDSLDPGSLMGQLKMSELIERARTLGAPNDVIDECMDHTDVRSLTRSADPIPEVSRP